MTGMNTSPNMSQPTSSTFKVGDRVRITATDPASAAGKIGTVVSFVNGDGFGVEIPDHLPMWYAADELAPVGAHDELIALVEQLGAVEHNTWVADGMLCRRYITADGSIDLTVRVP